MLKVLKASAGSGKTYALAKEYIRLLLKSDKPDAYRHVLAVTFTNKATDEMKRRILKELNTLATTPETSPYIKDFAKTPAEVKAVQERAKQQLKAILNDYSSFAVSTIDHFSQQALRAFTREIGQFSAYRVHVNRDELVAESVDRVLDGLTEEGDRSLLSWLQESVRDQLEQSGSFNLDWDLLEMAKSLRNFPEGAQFPRESIKEIRKACLAVRKVFEERVPPVAAACQRVLEEKGVDPKDSNHGFMTWFAKYAARSADIPFPTPAFMEKAPCRELWFAASKSRLSDQLGDALDAPMQAFLDCFGTAYKEYCTAGIILKQLYSLGVIAELRDAFVAVQKEKNLLSLDDGNSILKGIIDGSDAPFIYEKLGVRFEDFLLDEFQDTSEVQWDNFRPLLENAVASGKDSLVVGDVKQSIYRFRGSDWELLNERVGQAFAKVADDTLRGNWRTCRTIVDFNNCFFAYAASDLDQRLGTDVIATIYKDVAQTPCIKEAAEGSVDVCFTDDQLTEILQTLRELEARGALWSDVAILVRNNGEGSTIADWLLHNQIPVVSDDSLDVKASVTVRRLVSQLSLVEAPPAEDGGNLPGYLARQLGVKIPAGYYSLPDLAESILRDLRENDPETFKAEIPYIQSFMDYLQDWTVNGGGSTDALLRDWKDAKLKIASPRLGNAVRIMTIHKSKGLEFPFVIFPYAEEVELYWPSAYWLRPDLKGSALPGTADGCYYVNLDSKSEHSFFEADYRRERLLQAVDNLNIFYVALTRAKYGLKIIAKTLSKNSKSVNMSTILHGFINGDSYSVGEPFDFSMLKREADEALPLEADFVSYPADSGKRLKFSREAADYFGADGSVGLQASRRIRGSVLHAILADVKVPEDIGGAVRKAVAAGELPAAEEKATAAFLEERLKGVADKGWFSPEARVLNEAALIGPDGEEYRPDRVILHPDGRVTVLDYKFGEKQSSHVRQVQRYMDLYKKRGHAKVDGCLWYLEDNFITFVN